MIWCKKFSNSVSIDSFAERVGLVMGCVNKEDFDSMQKIGVNVLSKASRFLVGELVKDLEREVDVVLKVGFCNGDILVVERRSDELLFLSISSWVVPLYGESDYVEELLSVPLIISKYIELFEELLSLDAHRLVIKISKNGVVTAISDLYMDLASQEKYVVVGEGYGEYDENDSVGDWKDIKMLASEEEGTGIRLPCSVSALLLSYFRDLIYSVFGAVDTSKESCYIDSDVAETGGGKIYSAQINCGGSSISLECSYGLELISYSNVGIEYSLNVSRVFQCFIRFLENSYFRYSGLSDLSIGLESSNWNRDTALSNAFVVKLIGKEEYVIEL